MCNIERFPKNKHEDISKLSKEQLRVRNKKLNSKENIKKSTYKENYLKKHGKRTGEVNEKRCVKCNYIQPIEEFYLREETQKRRNDCRDCGMKKRGVKEVGKQRFAYEIIDKGFKRCGICKTIKPINKFTKNKGKFKELSGHCYECSKDLVSKYRIEQRENLGDWYVREWAKTNYGITEFSDETIEKYRNEIREKRKPKLFLDNKRFYTISEFAIYIKKKYGNPITMTEKRISMGKTEKECTLSEKEMRSKSRTKNVKITDTINGKVFLFDGITKNTKEIQKMFSIRVVQHALKTGELTKITNRSKYKNPCKVENY